VRVTVRLFASVREAVGLSVVTLDLPAGATVARLKQELGVRYPQLRGLDQVQVSVNLEYANGDHPIGEMDEVAVIPPVSGGSGHYEITEREITADALVDLVRSPECGAVAVFVGTSRRMSRGREVAYLDYDAYPEMATRKMRQIGEEIRQRWGVERVAIRHRIGRVDLGEASVIIAVATEHRADGFEACRYAIDRLKEIVPIWKKEVWVGGGEWIGWDCVVDPGLAPLAGDSVG
jgi:molybdopterin synthase catalytic subunit